MEKQFHQVKACLKTYLSRGQKALDYFKAGSLDQAIDSIRWQKAAFYNFKVVDNYLKKIDPLYLDNSDLQNLWAEIQEIDKQLKIQIELHKEKLVDQIQQTRSVKQMIQRFHSGIKRQSDFRDTV